MNKAGHPQNIQIFWRELERPLQKEKWPPEGKPEIPTKGYSCLLACLEHTQYLPDLERPDEVNLPQTGTKDQPKIKASTKFEVAERGIGGTPE